MKIQDYLTAGTITISNLILQNYLALGMTNQELLVYLQLLVYQKDDYEFPDVEQISKNLQIKLDVLYQILDEMSQKQIIQLKTHTNIEGKKSDYYDLLPIYSQLEQLLNHEENKFTNQYSTLKELITKLEQLLGRVLSSFEMEQARNWQEKNQYSDSLIELAMREAVINNVSSEFRYANRILQNWEKLNIVTVEEATQEIYKHRNQKMQVNKPKIKVPINHARGQNYER